MLTNEVTTITLQPDGTVRFRSYGDYLGRYVIRDGTGRGEPAGQDTCLIAITGGYDSSCTLLSNCTFTPPIPFTFTVSHDRVRDTILYTETGAPQFSGRWPFVRSFAMDCSGPVGCTGYPG